MAVYLLGVIAVARKPPTYPMTKVHKAEARVRRPRKTAPSLGRRYRGYKIKGDSQYSCMSTERYHDCPKHCNSKDVMWLGFQLF